MPYVCFLVCNLFQSNITSLKYKNITDKYNSEFFLSFSKVHTVAQGGLIFL